MTYALTKGLTIQKHGIRMPAIRGVPDVHFYGGLQTCVKVLYICHIKLPSNGSLALNTTIFCYDRGFNIHGMVTEVAAMVRFVDGYFSNDGKTSLYLGVLLVLMQMAVWHKV